MRGTARLPTALIATMAACGISAGCGSKKKSEEPPSCEAAVKHAFEVSDETDTELIAPMIELCGDEKWTAEQRTCLMKAPSDEAAERCFRDDDSREPRRPEAEIQLEAIAKGAKAYYIENVAFPVGSGGPVPAQPCCDSGRDDRRCEPEASQWKGTFQYSYQSDGATFTATAVGDLDCDDTSVTYTMTGQSDGGTPRHVLARPANPD